MTDPIAFRPSEQAEKNLTDYMTKHNLAKKSEAVNEIIEGRSFSLSPQTPTTPITSTPLNKAELTKRAKEFLTEIPLDVYAEIYDICVQTYKTWLFNQNPIQKDMQLTSPLTAYSMERSRSTPQ